MNKYLWTLLIFVFTLSALPAAAQNHKIGYANIELILAYMPETKTMNQQVEAYQKTLADQLRQRENVARTKLQEYQQLAENGATEDRLKPLQDELLELDKEIQKLTTESQEKLMKKRQDLLTPIVDKLDRTIKQLAADEGYDYILNTVDGSGVSVIVFGPEQHDLTRKVLTRLGVQIPDEG